MRVDLPYSHSSGTKTTYEETFIERMRELVRRGYKPKDAAQLVLQEVMLEDSNNPEILKQARADADEFLLRIREVDSERRQFLPRSESRFFPAATILYS
jgi:hypothetical protein